MALKFGVFRNIAIGLFLVFGFATGCSTDEPVATQYKRGQGEVGTANTSNGEATVNRPAPNDAIEKPADGLNDDVDANPVDVDNPPAATPPAVDPAQVQAQLVQEGTAIYNQRCASCHLPIEMSQKINRTAERIVQQVVRDIPAHVMNNVQWPNQQEALALEAALKSPQ